MEHHLVQVAGRKVEWWTTNAPQDTHMFVSGLSTERFHQQVDGLFSLARMHPEAAFLLARQAYSEMLEVAAAWFCARLQAPHALGVWVLSCSTEELRQCVLTLLTGGALPVNQKRKATLERALTDAAQNLGVPRRKLLDMWLPLLEDFIHLEIQAENLAVRRGMARVQKTPSQEMVAGGILLEYVIHYGALQPVPSEAVSSQFGVPGGCVTVEPWLSGGRLEVPFMHLQAALDALGVLLNLLRVEVGLKGLPYRPPVRLRRDR